MAQWTRAVAISRSLETPSFQAWVSDLAGAVGIPGLSCGSLAVAGGRGQSRLSAQDCFQVSACPASGVAFALSISYYLSN